jgi:hypothetical protein
MYVRKFIAPSLAALGLCVSTISLAAAPAAASTPANCTVSNLKVSLGAANGTAGSTYVPVRFKNVGSKTCMLLGFPGVSARKNGHQVGVPAKWDKSFKPTRQILKPGDRTKATLQIVNPGVFPSSQCRPVTATALRVFAPDNYHSHTVKHAFRTCSTSKVSMHVRPVGK